MLYSVALESSALNQHKVEGVFTAATIHGLLPGGDEDADMQERLAFPSSHEA